MFVEQRSAISLIARESVSQSHHRSTFAVALAVVAAVACHRAAQPTVGAQPRHVAYSIEGRVVRIDSSMISPMKLATLAPRVAALRLEPTTIALRVGDTVDVNSTVHVLAIDSTGASLGRIPVYDSRMMPGAAVLVGIGAVAGRRPGTSELVIGFPSMQWGRSDAPPTAVLVIEVRD